MDERKLLLQRFRDLPTLQNAPLEASPFQFPKRIDPRPALVRASVEPDTSKRSRSTSRPAAGAICNLRDALRLAAEKPEFGRTSIAEWEAIMQFAGSTIRRSARDQAFELSPSAKDDWSEHEAVNVSAPSANSSFNDVLLHRIDEGASFRHGHAILGSQGCGKSTLIKYLISKNAATIRNRRTVFSRFEFLKFWSEWADGDRNWDGCLKDYMTFIHLRDLTLDHFFDFNDGTEFCLKLRFQSPQRLAGEIARLVREVGMECRRTGRSFDPEVTHLTLGMCVAKGCEGNRELMGYVRELETDERVALIGALWDERCVVTIFDGMDSLQLEDAFQRTDQWRAVKHIIRNRRRLSTPTSGRNQGINRENDSIVVIRKSTAALLEFESKRDRDQLALQLRS